MPSKWLSIFIPSVVLVSAIGLAAGFWAGHSLVPVATIDHAHIVAPKAVQKPRSPPPDIFAVMASAAHPLFDRTLRDYTKARFRDVQAFESIENGTPTYFFCGWVNSVNAYGGYEGWKQFVVIEKPQFKASKVIYDAQIDDSTSPDEDERIVANTGVLVNYCGYAGGSAPQIARIADASGRDFNALLQYNFGLHGE
jgi:hypothetical protein